MAKIASDLKRAQRVLSLVIRAVERCFDRVEIFNASCGYGEGVYFISLTATIFEESFFDIDADVNDESSKKCVKLFLKEISVSVNKVISALQEEEEVFVKDIKRYGESYNESVATRLSYALMFLHIINSISVKN